MDSSNCRDAGTEVIDDEALNFKVEEADEAPGSWIGEELRACGIPEFGIDQWLLHFMNEALTAEMSDAKLLNFFCLARDRALGDDPPFIVLMEKVEALLFSRMPDDGPSAFDELSDGYEPEEAARALDAVCAGKLSDRHLVELFDLAATFRDEMGVGRVWEAVLYLSRAQILQRIKHVRARKAAAVGELQEGDRPRGFARNEDTAESTYGLTQDGIAQTGHLHIPLPVIPWMTHTYEIASMTFHPDMENEKLLDLVQLADYMRNHENNGVHSAEWQQMKRDAANLVRQRIEGSECAPLTDKWPYDTTSWRAQDYGNALRTLPNLDVPTLIHLHIQAGENAFLYARETLQGRWEVVGARCKAEIRRRIECRHTFKVDASVSS